MKILHVVGSLDPKDGGVVQVVLGMTKALVKNNIDVTLFAPEPGNVEDIKDYGGVKIKFFKKAFFSVFLAGHSLRSGYSPALAKALAKEAGNFDLVNTHSIWHYPHYAAFLASSAANVPFMSTVQGELTPWALKQQSAWGLHTQKKILAKASAIQAVSKQEAQNIKNFTSNPNIFVVPNGITPEDFSGENGNDWLFTKYPELKGKKIVLFLGRVNAGKGLEVLAHAFAKVSAREPDSRLLIVGPDEWGYGRKIKEILKRENVLDKTVFTGMLVGKEKLSVLKSSSVFVLLSESEAFSVTILEALYCGLPVIISPECNFPEVESFGAGKIIERDSEQLAVSLLEMFADLPRLAQMSENSKKLSSSGEYFYDNIAKKIIGIYEKIKFNV